MQKSESTPILIIGQGLAGTLLSYHLLKKNIKHKVIDVAKEGSAAVAAAGLINPIVVKRVTKTWQADLFYPYAHKLYQELESFLDKRFYYPMPIKKIYGKDDAAFWQQRLQKEKLDNYIATNAQFNLPDGIHQPFGYGTIHTCARLNMAGMLQSYRRYLVDNEMLIESDFNDEELIIRKVYIQWQHLKADKVIFCRGSFDAGSQFFKHLKWNNTKGELLNAAIPQLSIDYILSKGIFVMPVGNHQFKIGATYTHHWDNLESTDEKLQELLQKWSVISELPLKINKQLTGIRPTLADRRPVLQFLNENPRIGIFNGLGSRGGLMAPYLANTMVEKLINIDQ